MLSVRAVCAGKLAMQAFLQFPNLQKVVGVGERKVRLCFEIQLVLRGRVGLLAHPARHARSAALCDGMHVLTSWFCCRSSAQPGPVFSLSVCTLCSGCAGLHSCRVLCCARSYSVTNYEMKGSVRAQCNVKSDHIDVSSLCFCQLPLIASGGLGLGLCARRMSSMSAAPSSRSAPRPSRLANGEPASCR